jgi:hypothetical protein
MKLFGKRTDKKETKSVEANPIADTPAVATPKPARFKGKLTLSRVSKKKLVILVVGVIIVALMAWIFTAKRTQVTNYVTGKRCDETVITKYNNANRSIDNYAKEVEAVVKEVESKSGYAKDISCVYIVYTHYSHKQDASRSRELLETMKTLKQKGKSIDAKILDQKSFEDMEMYVKSLEHNRDIGDKRDGSG